MQTQLRMKNMMVVDLESKAEEFLESMTILEMETESMKERNEEEKMKLRTIIIETNDELKALTRQK